MSEQAVGTTVVLGWDGLDYDLVMEYGLTEAFGSHLTTTETIINDQLGRPHTQEVWPSIITGLPPEDHGFEWMGSSPGRAEWNHPLVDRASQLAAGTIPKPIRTWIGAQLQASGAELSYTDADEYAANGLETLFDGRQAFPITIPNYRTELDHRLELEVNREGQLGEFVNLEEDDGDIVHYPDVSLPELELRLAKEAYKKLGIVQTSLHRAYDIVFVWVSLLDTIGHLDPLTDSDWQQRGYRLAAAQTQAIRSELTADDTLVCLSDHGLQDGHHTHEACFGSNDQDLTESVDSVLDVKSALDDVTPKSGSRSGSGDEFPPIRAPFDIRSSTSEMDAEQIHTQLEDLGYL